MRRIAPTIALACLFAVTGCAHLGPILGEVLHRVSIDDVIRCADQPTIKAKALCLGVELLTPAADAALERAADLAHRAMQAESGSGSEADTLTEQERRRLAGELEQALEALETELAAADGGA